MSEADRGDTTLTLERRSDGVAVLWIDDPKENVNTLKRELADEFGDMLERLRGDATLAGLVIISGKPDSFVAGADLKMLQAVETAEEASALSRLSQSVQRHLETLRVPTVAAIHGACLGGGLEIALALDRRVATDDPATRLGLPEVRLGLLPAGGGTQRLPRLVGLREALDLLLTGRELRSAEALDRGLVDELVEKPRLLKAAVEQALALAGRGKSRGRRPVDSPFTRTGIFQLLLARNPIGRSLVFRKALDRVMARTRGNYPAPPRILEVVRIGLASGFEAGLAREAEAFGELATSAESRELVRLFFATRELKKDPGVDDPAAEPRHVERIGVLGAGAMGAGIAYVSAAKAVVDVTVKERDEESLAQGLERLRARIEERVRRGRMSESDRAQTLERLRGATRYADLEGCAVVIEAVFEDLELKRRVLQEVEAVGQGGIVFASNTSSIPIAEISRPAAHPENVIGMHYFSPVERMPLLEVVVTERTSPRTIATCVTLGKRQDKTVIVVRDGPGFYTSRILAPYMNEAAWLVSEGVTVDRIDTALRDFGFPLGPLALLDEVGIDVAHEVSGVLHEAFGARMQPPPGLQRLLDDGRLGKKNRRGCYRYEADGGARRDVDETVYRVIGVAARSAPPAEEIAERCVLPMINEAARCLDEGVLRCARDGDVGAVFGLGFPPFLGGPFRYADALGAAHLSSRLASLADRLGDRFAPAPVLDGLAREAGSFYRVGPP